MSPVPFFNTVFSTLLLISLGKQRTFGVFSTVNTKFLFQQKRKSPENAPTISNGPNTNGSEQAVTEVTLFHNIRFNGPSQTYKLSAGQCIGLDVNMKKEASSFRGACAILFDRRGCTGNQRKMEGEAAVMPFGWNNKVESMASCAGVVQTENFKNILTLYEQEHFRGKLIRTRWWMFLLQIYD